MKVRGLESFVATNRLLAPKPLSCFRGQTIAVDARWWLENNTSSKHLGGFCGGVTTDLGDELNKFLSLLKGHGIRAIWIFQGIRPSLDAYSTRVNYEEVARGWKLLHEGCTAESAKKFEKYCYPVTFDWEDALCRLLKANEELVIGAPYHVAGQMSALLYKQAVNSVYGPVELVGFNIGRVIVNIDKHENTEVLLLEDLATAVKYDLHLLFSLAGTDYSQTNPFIERGGGENCILGTCAALSATPQLSYMNSIPNIAVRDVLYRESMLVRTWMTWYPHIDEECKLGFGPAGMEVYVPPDFHETFGLRLSNSLYGAMARKEVSCALVTALATGRWAEPDRPATPTHEWIHLLNHLRATRLMSLGLLVGGMHRGFSCRKIIFQNMIKAEDFSIETRRLINEANGYSVFVSGFNCADISRDAMDAVATLLSSCGPVDRGVAAACRQVASVYLHTVGYISTGGDIDSWFSLLNGFGGKYRLPGMLLIDLLSSKLISGDALGFINVELTTKFNDAPAFESTLAWVLGKDHINCPLELPRSGPALIFAARLCSRLAAFTSLGPDQIKAQVSYNCMDSECTAWCSIVTTLARTLNYALESSMYDLSYTTSPEIDECMKKYKSVNGTLITHLLDFNDSECTSASGPSATGGSKVEIITNYVENNYRKPASKNVREAMSSATNHSTVLGLMSEQFRQPLWPRSGSYLVLALLSTQTNLDDLREMMPEFVDMESTLMMITDFVALTHKMYSALGNQMFSAPAALLGVRIRSLFLSEQVDSDKYPHAAELMRALST